MPPPYDGPDIQIHVEAWHLPLHYGHRCRMPTRVPLMRHFCIYFMNTRYMYTLHNEVCRIQIQIFYETLINKKLKLMTDQLLAITAHMLRSHDFLIYSTAHCSGIFVTK
jgi:hypothetical protein